MQPNDHFGDPAGTTRSFFESIPPAAFVALPDASSLAEAAHWSGDSLNMLDPAARPYAIGRIATHCVFVSDVAVMQHIYPVGDFWIVVYESYSAVLVKPQIDIAPGAGQFEQVRQIASVVLREELRSLYPMTVRGVDEVMRFSTLPLSGMGFGPSEVQGGIVGNRVYFLWEKAPHPMSDNPRPYNRPLPDELAQVWYRERAPHLAKPQAPAR